jgi:hypothetical protein
MPLPQYERAEAPVRILKLPVDEMGQTRYPYFAPGTDQNGADVSDDSA